MKYLLTRSTKIILEILLFVVLLSAIALGVTRSFFPQFDRYKPYFEKWASGALHQPVRIAHIQASWNGLHPVVYMEGVDVLDVATHQEQLHIKRLQISAQVIASLFQWRFIPDSITVMGTHLVVRRVDEHTLGINGVKLPIATGDTPSGDMSNIIGWLLSQGDIKLQNIDLDWTNKEGRLFQFKALTAELRHGFFRNRVVGVTTLMDKVPTRLRFVIKIRQVGFWGHHIRASCYFLINNLELAPWVESLPLQKIPLTQGTIKSLQVWAVWENNQWQKAQALIRLQAGQLNADFFKQPFKVDELSANIAWQHNKDGFTVAADQIKLVLNQQHWPLTQLSLQQSQTKQGSTIQIVRANALDLGQLKELASSVSLFVNPPAVEEIRRSPFVDPPAVENIRRPPFTKGVVSTSPLIYAAPSKELAANLAIAQTVPPFAKGGLGGIYTDPYKTKRNTLQDYFDGIQPQGTLTNVLIRREIPATGGEALISATTPPFGKGGLGGIYNGSLISASMDFSGLTTQAWQKVPALDGLQGKLKITPTTGELILNGSALKLNLLDLFDHPFQLEKYQGRIQWGKQENGLSIKASQLKLADQHLETQADFNLWLPKKEDETPYLQSTVTFLEHDSAHLRDYLPKGILKTHTALETWLSEAFVSGEGVQGNIVLQGPLAHFPFDDHTGRFSAAVTVKDMQFNYKTGWPVIHHLNARALFEGRSLAIEATPGATILNANAGEIKASIPDLGHAELAVQGNVQSDMEEGLRFIAQSPLQATIGEGLDNLVLQGGMKLDLGLQIPLHKDATTTSTVQGNVLISPKGVLNVPAWKIHLTDFTGAFKFTEDSLSADKLTAKWLEEPVSIHIDTQNSGSNHVIAAHVQGHTTIAALQKEYGLNFLKNKLSGETNYRALLNISREEGHPKTMFSVDSDLAGVAIDLPEPLKKTAAEKLPMHVETKTLEKSSLHLFLEYAKKLTADLSFLQQPQKSWAFKQGDIYFNQDTPSALGAALSSAHIQIQDLDKAWAIKIDSPNVEGDLNIPSDLKSVVMGNFSRFRVMPGVSKTVAGVNPGDIPPLNLQFKDFYYENRPFGAVSLLTSSGKDRLQIQRLRIVAPNVHIGATGRWQQINARQQQTTISGNLKSDNIGAALKEWQVSSSVKNGKGRAAFALSWPGPAYDFGFKQLNGSFSLAFDKGSIVNIGDEKAAEMGIGRVLNLLSLQSIPRRLALDFSDLLQKGFVFDVMRGDFSMKDGDAVTNNAYLNGPIAKVEIKGRIGTGNKDYDLLMITTPYVTSSLPLAATIVGGPLVGAATWVGSKVLNGVVNSITSQTYKVTGPWDKPVVEAVSSR